MVTGVDEASRLLGPVEPGWPTLAVVRTRARPDAGPAPGTVHLDDERGEVWIGEGGRVAIDRATMTVEFATATPLGDEALVHPYLGLPASFANRWLGRHAFHGGAFVHSDRAWALLGGKEGGKSSTLAWLLQRGHPVLADDIVVVDQGRLLTGPRCVDLREEAAARFGGEELGVVGARPRWRLRAPEAPASMPLHGVVHLAWGDRATLEPLEGKRRLEALVEHSAVRPGPEQAEAFLDLAALPSWRLVRPRRWEEFDRANEQLLAALDRARP